MSVELERVEFVAGQVPLPGLDDEHDDGVFYGDDEVYVCDCCEDEAAVADGLCDDCLDHGLGVHDARVVTIEPLARYL